MGQYNTDEADQSKSDWIRQTNEVRREIEEIRSEMSVNEGQSKPFHVSQLVEYYNRKLRQYSWKIHPKRERVEQEWNAEVASVKVPTDGTVDLGTTDVFGDLDVEQALYEVPWEETPVTLDNLNSTWGNQGKVSIQVKAISPDGSPVTDHYEVPLQLPVHAADAAFMQLNECVDKLGWLPDAEEQEYQAGNDEVLTHG